MHHFGIEAERGHQHQVLRCPPLDLRGGQVDPPNDPVQQRAGHRLPRRPHAELPGEEVLVAGRAVDHRHVGPGRLGRRQPDGSVTTHHHEGVPPGERGAEPCLGRTGAGWKELDVETAGGGGIGHRFRQGPAPAGPGNRVEDHEDRHRGQDTVSTGVPTPRPGRAGGGTP